jgi:hypothetical protein
MQGDDRMRMVRAVGQFIDAFPALVGAKTEKQCEAVAAGFPGPTGLGTDGSCWTDEECRSHVAAVCEAALKKLRKYSVKHPPDAGRSAPCR